MFILIFGVFTLLMPCLFHLCTHVSYATFNTNLNLYSKKKTLLISTECIPTYLSLKVLGLLILSECEKEQIVLLISLKNPIGNVIELLLQCNKTISRVISGTLPLYIFCISTTPVTCILCLIIIQIWCHSYVKRVTRIDILYKTRYPTYLE